MWFIIRTTICVGIVFSMVEGQSATGELEAAPGAVVTTLASMAPAGVGELMGGAFSICRSDPKFCLEAAQRFTGQGSEPAAQPSSSASPQSPTPQSVRLVADTLTAADRATPWHGPPKKRIASRD